MAVQVKAKRSRDGRQLDLKAILLPCRRDYPGTKPTVVKFIVDTGSTKSLVRRHSVGGVGARVNQTVYGIAGGKTPAAPFRAHLVFLSEEGRVRVLTTNILMIDAYDSTEGGVLGLDLVRGLELRDGEAVVELATSDADLRGSLGRVTAELEEVLGLEECGCQAFLAGALAADSKKVEGANSPSKGTSKDRLAARDRHERRAPSMPSNWQQVPPEEVLAINPKKVITDRFPERHERRVVDPRRPYAFPGEPRSWWDI